ncbi:N-acylglucosamine 2-epimerase [Oscillospiraceae bacterium HV4-5-C5C]|nr:N-acylglucosamine 2-epimerase [Oscillospiraceae bacterium HV4-5-C5C]
MQQLAQEMAAHLTEKLIPFWQSLRDRQNGGYYGYMGFDLKLDPDYDKGCILNSRILWFFSAAYLQLRQPRLLEDARQAYDFLQTSCRDQVAGGVFWSVTAQGRPADTTKHSYNQAFAIYALATYYDASGDPQALDLAWELYHLLETVSFDGQGYREAFDRDFKPAGNDKLSENGVEAARTMNTLLHLLEAYTELYRVDPRDSLRQSLERILTLFWEKVWNPALQRQEVFFDQDWHSLLDLYSYGHDIETSWLLDRTLELMGDPVWQARLAPVTSSLARQVYQTGWHEGSLWAEAQDGRPDMTRVWWVQAETVNGLINLWQKDTTQLQYLQAARETWNYIKTYMLDKRPGSEWFWAVDQKGQPLPRPIVEPWKCPYHNGRMCLEIMRRSGYVAPAVLC